MPRPTQSGARRPGANPRRAPEAEGGRGSAGEPAGVGRPDVVLGGRVQPGGENGDEGRRDGEILQGHEGELLLVSPGRERSDDAAAVGANRVGILPPPEDADRGRALAQWAPSPGELRGRAGHVRGPVRHSVSFVVPDARQGASR